MVILLCYLFLVTLLNVATAELLCGTVVETLVLGRDEVSLSNGDLFGASVASSGNRLVVGMKVNYDEYSSPKGGYVHIFWQESGSSTWLLEAKLEASDSSGGDQFGHDVDIDGLNLIAGAPYNDDFGDKSGSAYIFSKTSDENEFSEVAILTASDAMASAHFGAAVAVYANTAVVGSPRFNNEGQAYVFQETTLLSGDWTEMTVLQKALGNTGSDYFGQDVAIHGTTIIVGAAHDTDGAGQGSASVFSQSEPGNLWEQEIFLSADGSGRYGHAIAYDGAVIVVGSVYDSLSSAYVLERNSTGHFAQVLRLDSGDVSLHFDLFGYAVDVVNRVIAVGAPQADYGSSISSAYFESGTAHVFVETAYEAQDWYRLVRLAASTPEANDMFGESIALSSDNTNVYVGMPWAGSIYLNEDYEDDRGAVYIYSRLCGVYNDCSSSPCLNGGVCINVAFENAFTCDCSFTGSIGLFCETDLDDCGSHPCAVGEGCNDAGANNYTCFDLNDCSSSPCTMAQECIDIGADAFECIEIDDCASSPCDPIEGTYCNDTGEVGENAFECIEIDDCASSPCNSIKGTYCNDTGVLSYACVDINECLSSPCGPGALCADAGANEYICTDLDDCASSPCQNSGVCSDTGAFQYACDCIGTGFTGTDCMDDVDDCVSSPCLNNGVCVDTGINQFECDCNHIAFEGVQCQLISSACISSPCLNGGSCSDAFNMTYTCNCSLQYSGNTCEDMISSEPTWTSSGILNEHYDMVNIIISFNMFNLSDDITLDDYAANELPEILANDVGGHVDDFQVVVIANDDGTYAFDIIYANRNGLNLTTIESKIAEGQSTQNLGEISIHAIGIAPDEEASGHQGTDDDDNGAIVIIVVVVLCVVLLIGLAVFIAQRRQSNKHRVLQLPT